MNQTIRSHPASIASRRFHPLILAILTMMLVTDGPLLAAPAAFQLNDRVQTNVNGLGWITGTVIEIGQGDHEGKLKVHADDYPKSYDFWVRATMQSAIRKLAGAAPAAAPVGGANQPPRLGKYNILSYGAGANYLYLGHVELLAGGKYRVSRKDSGDYFGQGAYSFDAASKSVQWISGPYKEEAGWGGAFAVDRGGKTHTITLRGGTVATNSTD